MSHRLALSLARLTLAHSSPRTARLAVMPVAVSRRTSARTAPASTSSNSTQSAVQAASDAIAASVHAAQGSSSAAAPSADAVAAPKRRGRKPAAAAPAANGDAEPMQADSTEAVPKKRGRKAAAAVAADGEDVPTPAPRKKRAKKEVSPTDEDSFEDGDVKPKRARKARAKKEKSPEEPVEPWIPPPVEHRCFETEGLQPRAPFTGRLGYACLNTVLRGQKPPVFCSRNVRIKTIEEKGMEYVHELARANVADLIPMIEWSAANNIHFLRLSSEMFPFASHLQYGWDIGFLQAELKAAGDVAKRLGVRLTMHPGQFCQLGAKSATVLEASLREFEHHCRTLDLMEMDPDSIMILHGGGTYGDQAATLERIENTITTRLSPSARARLVLENDELSYSAEELLPLCEKLSVPLVFDWHHDALRPSSLTPAELMPRILAIFQKRGIRPKFHLSEPRAGAMTLRARRAHSDRCGQLPLELPSDADLMLECKDKEQGVLHMYRIYKLYEPDVASLRPEADDATTRTSGRRSKLDGSGGSSTSPRKKAGPTAKEQERSLIARTIAKAKEVAARTGRPYTGPPDEEDMARMRQAELSSRDVLLDMRRRADAVRADLKAGRPRTSTAAAEDTDEASALAEEPE